MQTYVQLVKDTLKHSIQEKWIDTKNMTTWKGSHPVEIFENPTRREVEEIMKNDIHNSIKLFYCFSRSKMYTHSYSAIEHTDIAKELGIKPDDFVHLYANGTKKYIEIYSMLPSEHERIEVINNFKNSEGYDQLKQLFPHYKHEEYTD